MPKVDCCSAQRYFRLGSLWLAFQIIFFDYMRRGRDPHNLARIQLKWLAIFVIELRKRNRVWAELQISEQFGQLLRPIGVSLQGLGIAFLSEWNTLVRVLKQKSRRLFRFAKSKLRQTR